MNNSTTDLVNVPSIDLFVYLNKTFSFITYYFPDFFNIIKSVMGFIIGLSFPVSVVFFIGIIVAVERLKSIRKREDEIYNSKVDMGYIESDGKRNNSNSEIAKKWDMVLTHVESENPNDWRQAIIEADIILGELLNMLGYKGLSIGEQLKRANKNDFKTLDDAWEAHKVRNELAHSGSDYALTQYDARRVIHKYRNVFEEFFYI